MGQVIEIFSRRELGKDFSGASDSYEGQLKEYDPESLLVIFACLPTISSAGLFKVVRVYDGDTVKAVGHDIEIKVRLVGIDTPETSKAKHEPGQPFGRKAEKYLAGLVLNRVVDIKGYGSDRYGRILAEIFIEEKNINLEMVKTGYAEVYNGSPPRGDFTCRNIGRLKIGPEARDRGSGPRVISTSHRLSGENRRCERL